MLPSRKTSDTQLIRLLYGSITMTQRVYIEKMASKYLVGGNTKKWTTPIDMSREGGAKFLALTVANGEREVNEMSGKDFSGLLGSFAEKAWFEIRNRNSNPIANSMT